MHQFLKSIGFHEYRTRQQEQELFQFVCTEPDTSNLLYDAQKECKVAYYSREVAPGMGIVVYGEFDKDEEGMIFFPVFYYPYVESRSISGCNECDIFRRSSQEDFIANCDDYRFGVTLIFHVINQNKLREVQQKAGIGKVYYALTALSTEGKILMPILKTQTQIDEAKEESKKRSRLIERARGGNENAIDILTVNEMNTFSKMNRMVLQNDLYTLIDSFFMPNGVECDMYSVMGDIKELRRVQNTITKEWIYTMLVECNDVMMRITINEADLLGVPEVGRRFKGIVWMQGYLMFDSALR